MDYKNNLNSIYRAELGCIKSKNEILEINKDNEFGLISFYRSEACDYKYYENRAQLLNHLPQEPYVIYVTKNKPDGKPHYFGKNNYYWTEVRTGIEIPELIKQSRPTDIDKGTDIYIENWKTSPWGIISKDACGVDKNPDILKDFKNYMTKYEEQWIIGDIELIKKRAIKNMDDILYSPEELSYKIRDVQMDARIKYEEIAKKELKKDNKSK